MKHCETKEAGPVDKCSDLPRFGQGRGGFQFNMLSIRRDREADPPSVR